MRQQMYGRAAAHGHLASLVTLACFALIVVAGAAAPARAVNPAAAARPVYFVPVGRFPAGDAEKLARYFGRRLSVRTGVLPSAALPRSAFNRARRQYVAQKLITVLHRPIGDSRVVIGLTLEDIYTLDRPDWRFAFSIRSPAGFAIVSRARMDPDLLGLDPDPALRMRRLQKMVMKTIGVLAFGLSQSPNPRSALYDSILGVDDLDYMTQDFQPAAPGQARQSWLGRSGQVCKRGVSEAKALLARSPLVTQDDFLAFAHESIALDDRHRSQLAAIPPSSEDRSAVRALLNRLKGSIRADRAAVAKLTARWSEPTLKSWLGEGTRLALELRTDALELGSRSCARYFDPATYSR
jgi:predicted Zn-dependent protease